MEHSAVCLEISACVAVALAGLHAVAFLVKVRCVQPHLFSGWTSAVFNQGKHPCCLWRLLHSLDPGAAFPNGGETRWTHLYSRCTWSMILDRSTTPKSGRHANADGHRSLGLVSSTESAMLRQLQSRGPLAHASLKNPVTLRVPRLSKMLAVACHSPSQRLYRRKRRCHVAVDDCSRTLRACIATRCQVHRLLPGKRGASAERPGLRASPLAGRPSRDAN